MPAKADFRIFATVVVAIIAAGYIMDSMRGVSFIAKASAGYDK